MRVARATFTCFVSHRPFVFWATDNGKVRFYAVNIEYVTFFSDLEEGDFLAQCDCISPDYRLGALGTTTRVYIGHLPDTC